MHWASQVLRFESWQCPGFNTCPQVAVQQPLSPGRMVRSATSVASLGECPGMCSEDASGAGLNCKGCIRGGPNINVIVMTFGCIVAWRPCTRHQLGSTLIHTTKVTGPIFFLFAGMIDGLVHCAQVSVPRLPHKDMHFWGFHITAMLCYAICYACCAGLLCRLTSMISCSARGKPSCTQPTISRTSGSALDHGLC